MAAVCGRSIAVERYDANKRRVTHRRRCEIAKRIVEFLDNLKLI